MKCSPWQVWLAIVQFEETSETKRRPVLIVDCDRMIALALKMTSHAPRTGDYALIDWEKARLDRPTAVIMQEKRLTEQVMLHQIGSVSLQDKLNIQRILKQHR